MNNFKQIDVDHLSKLTPEERRKVERAHNIVLIVVALFVIFNIAIFMRFLLTRML